ncbi:MAG: chromosome partitioning protein ParB, partial [Candidatus Sedimenticola sp. 6PFRAG1]
LNEDVKNFIIERRLEMGHARALLGIKEEAQSKAARQVVAQGLSVRETEKLVRRLQGEEPAGTKAKAAPKEDPNVVRLENNLTEKLGARVKIQQGGSGKGKLVISYNSLDELDGILDHIQ